MSVIYFFRNPAPQDPYELLFSELGWEVGSIPVLRFEYESGTHIRSCLEKAQAYSGIVCTSARAVKALCEQHITIGQSWKEKPVYTVGPATRRSLESLGVHSYGEQTGNAEELAHYILQHHKQTDLPLLFICGSSRRDELPSILNAGGMSVEECTVYHTHPIDSIDLDNTRVPDAVVFFSPSGVQAVLQNWPEEWKEVRFVAIGDRTASALQKAGHNVIATASSPTPEGLLGAIQKSIPISQTIMTQPYPLSPQPFTPPTDQSHS